MEELLPFAIALFIGALVGIEREKKMEDEGERGIGGIRTFILFAEAGAVSAWLARELDAPSIFVGAGLFVTVFVVGGYLAHSRDRRQLGLTTEIAALVVYLLGGTAAFGFAQLAVALAIATSAVLAFKQPLHGAVERIGRDDLYAALKLLIATFIVLPVLPDRTLDPWQALNPFEIWWLVILISGLSLVGYVATRWLGPGRGIALTGVFGGLASSTAVTMSLARRSRDTDAAKRHSDALAAGILLAWTVMFARIGILVGALDAALLRLLALPLAAMAIATLGFIALRLRTGVTAPSAKEDLSLTNPFSLTAAMRFAALFAAVQLLVKLAEEYAPASGVYFVAGLAGLTDVDAITLSMARDARSESLNASAAAIAILIAALTNTLAKLGLVWVLGASALRRPLALVTGGIVLLGAGAALWIR
ncbi:MAG TPA: MgtC/SapB family protein [Myxococcota bacterium]|nr:MgtC/SapB family protein [Myxococcota bacterium]